MARTNFVKERGKGQKGPHKELRCNACGQPIEVGQPYKWFKMKLSRGGVKKSYHPDCTIPPSHRTTSRMGRIWDAQASLDLSGATNEDEVLTELASFAETVREVGEEYGESADNMEEGFGHATYGSDELREKAEALETWADELENWSFNGDEEPVQGEEDTPDEEPESDDDYEERLENWRQEIRDEAQGEVDNCPV